VVLRLEQFLPAVGEIAEFLGCPVEPLQQLRIGRFAILFEVVEHQVGRLTGMFQVDWIGRPRIVGGSLATFSKGTGIATVAAAGLAGSITGLIAAWRRRVRGAVGLRLPFGGTLGWSLTGL